MIEYEWESDLANIAYTEEYIKYFDERCAEKQNGAVLRENADRSAGMGYILREHIFEKGGFDSICSCTLVSPEGRELFEFRTIQCTLHRVIIIKGKPYFFYTDDLYGYNVVRLEDMKEFRYFPKASFGQDDFRETFIWTDVIFNEETGLLAAEGCYWACYYEVMLYEIPDIMSQFTGICCPREFCGYDYYDISDEKTRWEDSVLVISCDTAGSDDDEVQDIQLKLSVKDCMSHMHKVYQK